VALPAGTRLGPYEILEPLGAGGMGEVYRARDTRLDRTVAVKVLPENLAADPQLKARFQREARAISALAHPNICTLHDVGEEDGQTFLVMEHLAGQTLAERLKKGPLSLGQALEVAAEIADALAAAHSQGIVHRDLKPSNVMLTRTGARLLDFGLAQLTAHGEQPSAESLPSAPTRDAPLTGQGTILGTLPYMAPEQVEGRPADARTDLWALGAVLYEMLTGRRPFDGGSTASLTAAILEHEPPPLSALDPQLPPALEHVVGRCLAKDADARWQTARDVANELEWISQGGTAVTPKTPAARGWRWRLGAVAAIVLAVAAGVTAVRWWRGHEAKPVLSLDPNRVVVALFENRTGDKGLDTVALMATQAVGEGLLPIEGVEVVPGSTVLALARARPESGSGTDPVQGLAQATGAGLVVSGALYLQGQTLQLRGAITDAVAGRPLYAVEPASGARDEAMPMVDTVRQRIVDAVAAHCLHPEFDLLVEEARPPAFAAQREFATGWQFMGSLPSDAASHFTRAVELEPGFASARYGLHVALNNQGNLVAAKEQLDLLEKDPARLTRRSERCTSWASPSGTARVPKRRQVRKRRAPPSAAACITRSGGTTPGRFSPHSPPTTPTTPTTRPAWARSRRARATVPKPSGSPVTSGDSLCPTRTGCRSTLARASRSCSATRPRRSSCCARPSPEERDRRKSSPMASRSRFGTAWTSNPCPATRRSRS
jgi:hypothetical protein